jgi:hypothetical protein
MSCFTEFESGFDVAAQDVSNKRNSVDRMFGARIGRDGPQWSGGADRGSREPSGKLSA